MKCNAAVHKILLSTLAACLCTSHSHLINCLQLWHN